jgi:ribosomal protein S18
MFLLNLPRHICGNALLGQRNLVKAIKNGTRIALKLV